MEDKTSSLQVGTGTERDEKRSPAPVFLRWNQLAGQGVAEQTSSVCWRGRESLGQGWDINVRQGAGDAAEAGTWEGRCTADGPRPE